MDTATTTNNTTTQVDTTHTNPLHASDSTHRPRHNRRPRRPPQANTDQSNDATQAGDTGTRPPQRPRNQNPRPPRDVNQRSRQDQSTPGDRPLQPPRRRQGGEGGGEPRQPRPRRSNDDLGPSGAPSETPSSSSRPASRNNRPKKRNPAAQSADNNPSSTGPPRQEGNSRRAKFGSTLTQPSRDGDTPQGAASSSKSTTDNNKRPPKPRRDLPQGDDLTSTLTRALSTPPYPDCPICFNSIRPDQAIWSCSPLLPIIVSDVQIHAQYCWTSFHIKCIRSWAEKNVKDVAEAWRARGEPDKKGDWRCPGCQGKREVVPHGYQCFCGSTLEPKPLRMSTPHSCGSSCSRVRESGCGHPCPLRCHPGPCPPCQVTTQLECYCPRKSVLTFRCGTDSRGAKLVQKERDLSCGQICGRTLNCGTHTCERVCHEGDCGTCEAKETDARCFCGKDKKDAVCGRGEKVQCFVEGEEPWVGRFSCEQTCERPFDCGIHKCQKPCHVPPAKPPPCPRSPSKIAYCPCGRNAIAPSDNANSESGQYAFPARTSCTSPIPTCSNPCSKPHPACGHLCQATCHEGPCPPCYEDIVRPCRCGATTKKLPCFKVSYSEGDEEQKEILCDKPCMALRACGKHQCRRVCCPLASLAGAGGGRKGKKSQRTPVGIGLDEGAVGGWHECDLVCGKTLNCGLHQCEMKDHKGPCRPCLRSSFEEMVCPCGRTVYEPPVPCGTVMQCHYPCPLPPASSCGHPGTPHSCHPVGTPCPPCVFLTTKLCACGKNRIPNVKCSLDREMLNCGTVCGKLMGCGFHSCEKRCHAEGECGSCTAVCGKARKSCLPEHHPCPLPCHAPSSCPETTPCFTPIVLTCPCGRIKHSVPCGRTSSSPALGSSSSYTHPGTPKCTSECQIAKRNARLAEALGINTDRTGSPQSSSAFGGQGVTYSDDVVGFANANPKFLALVEKTFAEFINGTGTGVNTGAIGADVKRKTQVLPHMPVEKRKFVHDLAAVYRIDTLMIDQEPHRSVQLIRRIDSRIPTPLLSAHLASNSTSTAAASSLGKLRGLAASSASSWRTGITPGTGSPSTVSGSASTSGPSIVSVSSSRGWAPVPVNKPVAPSGGQSGPGSRTASPGPGLMKVAGVPGSSAVSTPPSSLSTLPVVSSTTAAPAGDDEDVPENWEDDI